MILEMPIKNIPNQQFTVQISNYLLTITLKTARDMTLFSLAINSEAVCSSVRCCPNSKVFLTSSIDLGGVFYWHCPEGNYPHYELFTNQKLVFIPTEDMNGNS